LLCNAGRRNATIQALSPNRFAHVKAYSRAPTPNMNDETYALFFFSFALACEARRPGARFQL
jgi:hypothetical protein